jgi:hypothetical protein
MRYLAMAMLTILISACGGGGDAKPSTAPGGTYLGFYQEDAVNNPEDPTAGAFVIQLPEGNQSFSGNMFFTYVGCQSTNVGRVSGARSNDRLSGTWSGTLDGEFNSGNFSASYDRFVGGFVGNFDRAGGKVLRDLRPCILYHIAAKGSLEAYPARISVPSNFVLDIRQGTVKVPAWTNAKYALVYVVDGSLLESTRSPVVWQNFGRFDTHLSISPTAPLTPGKEYLVGVAVLDANYQRLAFGSQPYLAN